MTLLARVGIGNNVLDPAYTGDGLYFHILMRINTHCLVKLITCYTLTKLMNLSISSERHCSKNVKLFDEAWPPSGCWIGCINIVNNNLQEKPLMQCI